ncbi:hypothetical protein ACJMK2_041691 [Sinanodonta woodiana]|uniref:Glucosidase 2 subunit beta n=1 Tax=Sinanodonta woodiana TaxID=1069815 RepID=A0ABD3W4Y9_SINWO
MKSYYLLQFFAVLINMGVLLATIPRPMGVSISMTSFYNPEKPFRCLDGLASMPFEYVNDDYCDCSDGSDEPGTSACPNGKFHCTNPGYLPSNILASRVNDGICDCCDGTDEWGGKIECVNNCKELGKKLREELERINILQEEGFQQRTALSEEGKRRKEEKKTELEQLEKERIDLEAIKIELEAKKKEVEGPEKEAKDKHQKAWEESKSSHIAEMEKVHALVAFHELDTNDDKLLTIAEAIQHSAFDKDQDGTATEQEVKEHLEDVDQADFDHFLEKVWPNIKDFYKPSELEEPPKGDKHEETESVTTSEPPTDQATPYKNLIRKPPPLGDEEFDEEDADEEEEEEEGEDLDDDVEEKKEENKDDEKMPEYDEETKALIAAADEVRIKFNDAESKLRDADRKISDLKNYMEIDFGPDEEFSQLMGHCFEYTDREYTYKLCPFDRATQKPKNGGSETTLGRWGEWNGPAEDKYYSQLYTKGQGCWNGPDRSTKVILACGLENQLTGTSEPSRCEYQYTFSTPSACKRQPQKNTPEHLHTEL